MDGAEADGLYTAMACRVAAAMSRRAWRPWRRRLREQRWNGSSSADLGGSSRYSSETLEDWRGERFHGNCGRPWV